MKTNLFSKLDLSDDFRRDLKALFALNWDALKRLPEHASRILLVPTVAETENERNNASQSLGIPRAQLDHAVDVTIWFFRKFMPQDDAAKDDPKLIVDDLTDTFALPASRAEDFVSFFNTCKSLSQQSLRLQLLRRAHEQSTLPTLKAISYEVDFRAVFEQDYKYDEDIAAYTPTFLGTVPVGLLRLRLDDGEPERVFFQLDKKSLQVLIDNLVALQKEIASAEKHLPSEPGKG